MSCPCRVVAFNGTVITIDRCETHTRWQRHIALEYLPWRNQQTRDVMASTGLRAPVVTAANMVTR